MSTSIELFHLYYREFSQDNKDQVQMLFLELEHARRISLKEPVDLVRMVMIDDQPVPRRLRANFFTPIISQLPSIGVDFVVYEKDLNRGKAEWLKGQSNAQELSRKIKKVYSGEMKCSHYVAVWYFMRLGVIPDFGCFLPVSERALLKQVSPIADKLKNYLPKKYMGVEKATELEILSQHKSWREVKGRIERVYV